MYSDVVNILATPNYFQAKTILTPTYEYVNTINDRTWNFFSNQAGSVLCQKRNFYRWFEFFLYIHNYENQIPKCLLVNISKLMLLDYRSFNTNVFQICINVYLTPCHVT